jgi:hypothetical protein
VQIGFTSCGVQGRFVIGVGRTGHRRSGPRGLAECFRFIGGKVSGGFPRWSDLGMDQNHYSNDMRG